MIRVKFQGFLPTLSVVLMCVGLLTISLIVTGKSLAPSGSPADDFDIIAGFVAPEPNTLGGDSLERVRMRLIPTCDKNDEISNQASSLCNQLIASDFQVESFNVQVRIIHEDGSVASTIGSVNLSVSETHFDEPGGGIHEISFANLDTPVVEPGLNEVVARIDFDDDINEQNEDQQGGNFIRQYLNVGPNSSPQIISNDITLSNLAAGADQCDLDPPLGANPFADIRISYTVTNNRAFPSDDIVSAIVEPSDGESIASSITGFIQESDLFSGFFETSSIEPLSNRTDSIVVRNVLSVSDERSMDICIGLGEHDLSPANNCDRITYSLSELCQIS